MNKLFIILILFSFSELFSVWGIGSNCFLNANSNNNCDIAAYSSLYHIYKTKNYFGAGVMYDFKDKFTATAEYYHKYKGDGFGCYYNSMQIGITSDKELHIGLSHTKNILLFNLKFNYLQIRLKKGNKPVFGIGIGLGIGLQNSIVKP